MKKRIVAMLVAAVLCMGVTGALAAYGRGYVDADGDGVCDNCQNGGRGQGQGQNWVDADGDGACDNCQNGGHGQGKGGRFRNTCWRMAL